MYLYYADGKSHVANGVESLTVPRVPFTVPPGQGLVPEPPDEEQEAEREIEADDAVRDVVVAGGTSPAQGRAPLAAAAVHHVLSQSPGRRRPRPATPRLVRDVIAARGSPGFPDDVVPAAAAAPSFPAAESTAAATAAAAAAVSR